MNKTKDKIAVVLLQFGGPDSLDAVEPFLFNLFNDPDIVQVPFGFLLQKPLAKYISRNRVKSVREKYAEIGGKSPIIEKTELQRQKLQEALDEKYGAGVTTVLTAMRYWKPFTNEIISELQTQGIQKVVLLPLYAQYSKTNIASCYNEWDRVLNNLHLHFDEKRIQSYHLDPTYLASINEKIDQALKCFPSDKDVYILFSAHGIPIDLVFEGDPYPIHIRETMEAVMDLRRRDFPYSLSYQSKIGPKQWLTPSTEHTIKEFGANGMKKLLIVPIAFVSDHIETIHELDIELREVATDAGIEEYIVMEGLNDSPLFIQTLAALAEKEIESF